MQISSCVPFLEVVAVLPCPLFPPLFPGTTDLTIDRFYLFVECTYCIFSNDMLW